MFVSAAWIVPAILGGIDTMIQPHIWGGKPANWRAILFNSGDWLLYALLTPGVFAISRRWPLTRPHLPRRIPFHILMSLMFCVIWAGAGTMLRVVLEPRGLGNDLAQSFLSWVFVTFPFGVAVYLSMVGVEHAVRYFEEAREREVQLAGARFAALQAQLNPHFLFNTLNTIAVLVRDGDRTGATTTVENLSEMLRRTLGSHRTVEVPLREELDLVRQYLAIEQARFSDRLRPEFDVPDATLAAAVPSFALQHLVENAIRHGIARLSEAGHVRVAARRDGNTLELTVTDDGPGIDAEPAVEPSPASDRCDISPATSPAGHGIANTRERLRSLYGDRASLDVARNPAGGTTATLRLPYRESA